MEVVLRAFPPGITQETLTQLLEDTRNREELLQNIIRRFEQRYNTSLKSLETRLDHGEGSEHPDWEDSIEWRNAVETLQRTRVMRNLLEWLLRSIAPSLAS